MIIVDRRGHCALLLAALIVATMPWYATGYHMELASTALIWAMFALSFQLLLGGVGLVSLGHAAFFGIGAYTGHLLTNATGVAPSILISLPAAALLAGLASLLVGIFALRTKGFFFLMTTLAFGQMLYFLFQDTPLGGGTDGIFIKRSLLSFAGFEYVMTRQTRPVVLLYLNLSVLMLIYAGLVWVMRSLFGHALQGIRANEGRMQAMGFHTAKLKLAAFTLAGSLAGLAGHMWAMHQAFVSPELLSWHQSAEALLMVLLGGIGALHGPIIGAVALVMIGEVSQILTERQRLVQGLVMLLVVLALPQGLAAARSAAPAAPPPR